MVDISDKHSQKIDLESIEKKKFQKPKCNSN